MAEPDPTSDQLQIRCPNCGQRFKVSDDLRGKLVECGSCEQRFRVNDEVVLRTKKFYPGESKRNASLDRFARAPLNTAGPVGFETVSYDPATDANAVEPPSMQRIMAGAIGAGLIIFVLLLFLLSTGAEGPLGNVSTQRRMVLALFIGVIGSSFILYANHRRIVPALFGCMAASALLLVMPLLFPGPEDAEVQQPPPAGGELDTPPSVVDDPPVPKDPHEVLKELIRYGPVEAEIAAAGAPERVTAIWLRGMRERHKWTVEDYLLRVTRADHGSHLYPRGDQGFLMVLTGMEQEIGETAQACKRIGRVERVIRSLRVIEVHLDANMFAEAPIERLSDVSGDAFYALNLKELGSIDLGRVERAVQRLSNAEPAQFRSDISGRLIELLSEAPLELCEKIAEALVVWSLPDDGADEAVLAVVRRFEKRGKRVGEGVLGFLVRRQVAEVQPSLHKRWVEEPDSWEELYAELGDPARVAMLAALAEERISIRDSAVRILGRVGNAATIPALEALKDGRDPELDSSITRSIAQIRSRHPEGGSTEESPPDP
jgi:predicted Zn finger-like uncharacterized protein